MDKTAETKGHMYTQEQACVSTECVNDPLPSYFKHNICNEHTTTSCLTVYFIIITNTQWNTVWVINLWWICNFWSHLWNLKQQATLAVTLFRILSKVLFSCVHKNMTKQKITDFTFLLLLCFLALLIVSICISCLYGSTDKNRFENPFFKTHNN
jgi:hypothetical protein